MMGNQFMNKSGQENKDSIGFFMHPSPKTGLGLEEINGVLPRFNEEDVVTRLVVDLTRN